MTDQATMESHDQPSMLRFWPALLIALVLLVSGSFHLLKFLADGLDWSGPLSVRKPALFGISSGLTVWSLVWLMTQVRSRWFDGMLLNAVSVALLVEVALITLQYWRGVASHFNRSTTWDSTVEGWMLGLILGVAVVIGYMTLRSFQLRSLDPSMVVAIQGGMLLLALSCGLGVLTTVLGEFRIRFGETPELWGSAGVLKFPHGAALHAIQVLPMVSWVGQRLVPHHSVRIVQSALASQIAFVIYACWQTAHGRDRLDWDEIGGVMLLISFVLALIPAVAIALGAIAWVRYWMQRSAI